MLTTDGCQRRLTRLRRELGRQGIDLAVLSDYRTVYYFSGHLREVELPQLFVIGPKGRTVLITDAQPTQCSADEVFAYEAYSIDWPVSFSAITLKAAQTLREVLKGITMPVRRIGLEKDRLSALFGELITACFPDAEQVETGPITDSLRRCKDLDEVGLIADCVKAIEAGYSVARSAIRPGATELDVFKEIHGEIVRQAGYNLKFEADFACGIRAIKEGGSPLRREIVSGDLYIIDIYPSFQGYHGDLCRTFAVSEPTGLQLKAWEIVRNALSLGEELIRPGVRARDVYTRLSGYINSFEFVRGSFWHHAGHGLGLEPQEPPWIIPGSEHIFEAGDVIAIEPACYSEALHGGVRLERDYIVRDDFLEPLSCFPLDL
jgi:Xaa-Pro aminopeptidase